MRLVSWGEGSGRADEVSKSPLTNSQVMECSRSDSSRRMTMLGGVAVLDAGLDEEERLSGAVAAGGECDWE